MKKTSSKYISPKCSISETRRSQFRAYIDFVNSNMKNNDLAEKYLLALDQIQQAIPNMNEWKRKYVERFVNYYLWSLTKSEIDNLWTKIKQSIDLIKVSEFYEDNENNFEESLFDIISYPDQFELKEVLSSLLINLVLLPYYENQKQFNKEMIWIIERLDNFVKLFFDSNLLVYPINKEAIFNYYDEFSYAKPLYVRKHLDHNFLKTVFLNIDLPSLDQSADYTSYNNYVKFGFDLYVNEIKFRWDELEKLFDWIKSLEKIEKWTYLAHVWDSNNVKVFLQFSNIIFKKDTAWNYDRFVEVSYKIEPNIATEWDNEDIFLDNSLVLIPRLISDLYEKLNKHFWWNSKYRKFINFNPLIWDSLPSDIEDRFNSYYDEENNEKKWKILKFASLWDVVDKLFLPEKTKLWYEMLYNYLKNKEKLDNILSKPLKWAVLYWPHWTGKTESIKKLAKDLGMKVIVLSIEDILRKFLWESEERIRQVFDEYFDMIKTSEKPIILFIDEIDWFFGNRWSDSSSVDQVRSIMLQQIEWFSDKKDLWKKWFIVSSTNFVDKVDAALKRRLNFQLKFDLPDEKVRKEYILYLIDNYEKKWVTFDKDKIDEMVSATKWLSQSIISSAFDNTIILSGFKEKLSIEDFKKWIDYSKSNSENGNSKSIWFMN